MKTDELLERSQSWITKGEPDNHVNQKHANLTRCHFYSKIIITKGVPGGAGGKEPICQCRRCKRHKFNPWVRKIPWRRAWQPTPVLLPGEYHRQMSLAGYSPEGCKESDTTLETQHACNHNQDGQPTCHCVCLVTQLCLTLCGPPPVSSIHEKILQQRIQDQIAIPFSKGSSQPKD